MIHSRKKSSSHAFTNKKPAEVQRIISNEPANLDINLLDSNSIRIQIPNKFLNLLKSRPLKDLASLQHKIKNSKDSKRPIKFSVASGDFLLANELKEKGFHISATLIFDSISKHESESVSKIISSSLYSHKNIELAFWFLLFNGYLSEANILWENEVDILRNYCEKSDFATKKGKKLVISQKSLMEIAFEQAVESGIDNAACALIHNEYTLLSIDRLAEALESGCVNMLRLVFIGDLHMRKKNIQTQIDHSIDLEGNFNMPEKKTDVKESEIWKYLLETFSKVEDVEKMWFFMNASNLISFYLSAERYTEVRKIISWESLRNDGKILNLLIQNYSPQLACEYILKTNLRITTLQLNFALMNKLYEVCYAILRVIETDIEITTKESQIEVISLLDNSETCLLAAEILNRISLRAWEIENTLKLCQILKNFIIKRQEIIYCANPLLFCILTASVLENLSNHSNRYRDQCLAVKDLYVSFGVTFQESISDGDALKHYLTEKDSTGKTSLEIIAHKNIHELLENDDVGNLVTRIWIGSENFYGLHVASSIVNTVLAPAGSEESMQFARGTDESKPYNFQLIRWTESCGSRFVNFGYLILVLIVLYQVLLYSMVSHQSFLNMENNGYEVELFGTIVALIFGIGCEQILAIMFSLKTRGTINIDMWKINDWAIGLLVIFISVEVPRRVYENGTVTFNSAYLGSGIIHSIMLGLITLKLWRYLIVSQKFGKFLSLILLVFKEIVTFLVIFAGFTICSAAIFTLLFRATYGYNDLSQSVRTLVQATIGPFVINAFMQDRDAFGAIMLSIFLLIAHILLLNLLIGIVNNVFKIFQTKVSSEFRSELIKTYYENQWSDSCGILILVPTPLSALTLLFSPLVLLPNSEKWNHRLTKILFSAYVLPYFIIFVVISLAAIPVAYLQGFLIYGRTGRIVAEEKPIKIFDIPNDEEVTYVTKFSYLKSLFWTFIGPFWLLFAFFRDCFTFWKIAYLDTPTVEIEQSIVNHLFIINFQKTLQELGDAVVTSEMFYQSFKKYDIFLNEKLETREEECLAVLEGFTNPLMDRKIECTKIQKLLPKAKGGEYDEEYVERFKNFRLPLVCKGVVNFQKKMGRFGSYKKEDLHKAVSKETFEEEIEKVENYVQDLHEKILPLIEKTRTVVDETKRFRIEEWLRNRL